MVDPSLPDYPLIRQGRIKRDYLNQTSNSHGYNCQPMTAPNVNGWEICLSEDVIVEWDGIVDSTPDHIKIIKGIKSGDRDLVVTHTGNGMLTFFTNIVVETDKDHHILVSGPPNYFFDGASPTTAILKTNIFNFTELFLCWKMTKANEQVLFPKGMPIAFIINYPINLLEETEVNTGFLHDNPNLSKARDEYGIIKRNWEENHEPWEWSHHYRDGVCPAHPNGYPMNFKPKLKDPKFNV